VEGLGLFGGDLGQEKEHAGLNAHGAAEWAGGFILPGAPDGVKELHYLWRDTPHPAIQRRWAERGGDEIDGVVDPGCLSNLAFVVFVLIVPDQIARPELVILA